MTIALDTAQYQLDMEYMQEHKSEDVYSTFNLLMRRKPKVSVACPPLHLLVVDRREVQNDTYLCVGQILRVLLQFCSAVSAL